MTVVAVPPTLLGDRALRRVNCTSACSSLDIEQTQQLHHPTSGLYGKQHSGTFAHSQIPGAAPAACASRAATEAATTRLFELSPNWSTTPSGEETSASTSPLRTGVPE
jgi:hypothetical protein